jgi:hypothetical protein
MKKLFTLISALAFSTLTFAQSIGMIGAFSGWSTDVVMNTTNNVTFTLTGYTIPMTGAVKFRQFDFDPQNPWAINWGSSSFPTGTGTQGGADIPVPAGTYDITFDITTGDYSFTAVSTGFDVIGFTGGFNNFSSVEPMITTDGVIYTKSDFYFSSGLVKFVRTQPVITNWGGSTFPIGTGVQDGTNIPLSQGFYNVSFNKNTLEYTFDQVPIGIIGTAVPPYDWSVDVPMSSTDGGVTNYLYNYTIIDGLLKFRANGNWATNWGGGTDFPSGTASLGGVDIPVPAGTYDTISFNRVTGEYNFVLCSPTSSIQNVTECTSFSWNGNTYTQSGTYTFNTTNATGCDSTATLILTINQPNGSSTTDNACGSFNWNGTIYTQSGTYTFLTTNSAGCDSVATLDLTIIPVTGTTTSQTACNSYTWTLNSNTYTTSGIYTYNSTGCNFDTLYLTINNAPLASNIAVSNDTILSVPQQNGLSYQWINCDNISPIVGANSNIFNVSENGSYAVIASNQCGQDTSDCQIVDNLNLNHFYSETIQIYPNPTSGQIVVNISESLLNNNYKLLDFFGRTVLEGRIVSLKESISLDNLSSGTYLFKLDNWNVLKTIVKF